ncbi:MAG: polymer-forming cytoskeletal protein [Verrucomicrobiota bacterium]
MQASNPSKNLLNGDVEIKGSIKFSSELTFDGKLEGDVQTDGTLTVGENANVTGNINAQVVLSRGKINGNIVAKDKVELKARSELFGDIRAAKLMMEEGVTFVGKIEVNPNKVAPGASQLRGAEPPKAIEPGKPIGR